MNRALLTPVLCVTAGLFVGVYAGVYVLDFQPAIVGWLFGAGAGVSGGAFVAAMATNTALVGRGDAPTRRGVIVRHADDDDDDLDEIEDEGYLDRPSRN